MTELKIYLSGILGQSVESEAMLAEALRPAKCLRCFTFYYIYPEIIAGKENRYRKSLDWAIKNHVGVMLDSGAHTLQKLHGERGGRALTGKKSLQQLTEEMLQSYAQFCLQYQDKIDFCVTYDYQSNFRITYDVTERLSKMKVKAIPVFHGDQQADYLGRYIARGHRYLGISGLYTTDKARFRLKYQMEYLDSCFAFLHQYPGVRTHGFATTRVELMMRYPWTSVDSSTWLKMSAYGKVLFINPKTKRFEFVHVSKRGSQSDCYWNLEKKQKRFYDQIFEQQKTSIGELSQDGTAGQVSRAIFNAKSLVQNPIRHDGFKSRFEGLF